MPSLTSQPHITQCRAKEAVTSHPTCTYRHVTLSLSPSPSNLKLEHLIGVSQHSLSLRGASQHSLSLKGSSQQSLSLKGTSQHSLSLKGASLFSEVLNVVDLIKEFNVYILNYSCDKQRCCNRVLNFFP